MRLLSLVLISIFSILPIGLAAQQDTALTRSLTLQNSAAGKQLLINQIDTSQFPAVNIFATVLDSGAPVSGLTSKDFRVREDEVDQEPLKVIPRLSPLSVVVTIDTSGSMSKALAQTKEAAKSFLDSLDSGDNVRTLGFARGVMPLSEFSQDKSQSKAAIDRVIARGDTALYDALYASVESLKNRPGRKAVALLSDGVDDDGTGKQLSKHSVDDVLKLAQAINVPIYTIGLGAEIDMAVLQRVATETGALYFSAPTVEELKGLYASLGKQLSGQYNILYTSNLPGDGSNHRVQLTQGSLTATKEYLSPAIAESVPMVSQAPEPPPAPIVAAGSGPIDIVGGTDFDTAVLISAGQTYKVKGHDDPKMASFFRVQIPQGSWLHTHGQLLGSNRLHLHVFDSLRKELNGSSPCYNRWCTDILNQSVAKESDGIYYLVVESKDEVAFGALALNGGDLGQQADAGAGEGGALDISENTTYTSHVSQLGDDIDFYRIKLEAGDKKIRVRPSSNCLVNMNLFNDEGEKLADVQSPNEGAGFTQELKVKSPGTYVLRFRALRQILCPYSFIVGTGEVQSPAQPDIPKEAPAPNLRTGI